MDPYLGAVSISLTDALSGLGAVAVDDRLMHRCARAADIMVESLRAGQRIWFCGNGGSAAEAQHLAAELSGRFMVDRPALPAEALHVNSSYLTAVANDFGYDATYSRLLDGVATPGDVLVCLSTSGNSGNVVEAARTARLRNVHTIALTGPTGGRLAPLADVVLTTPPSITATSRIQEVHLLLGHTLCEIVEATLFGGLTLDPSPTTPAGVAPPRPASRPLATPVSPSTPSDRR
jgi:D-sedoheptulose 7-phosphate isomerase